MTSINYSQANVNPQVILAPYQFANASVVTASGSSGLVNDGVTNLTAEALLCYCQAQLNSLDAEISDFMDRQKAALREKELLRDIESHMTQNDFSNPSWDRLAAAFDAAIQELAAKDPALAAQLQGQKDQIWAKYYDKPQPTAEGWKIDVDSLRALLDNVKDNAELEMIKVQSLMSARQTAVQLTTGMMAKFDQTIQSIVKNI